MSDEGAEIKVIHYNFFRLRYDRIIIKYEHIFHSISFTCVFVLRLITSFISLEKLSIHTRRTFTETETSNLNELTSSEALLLGYLYPLKNDIAILSPSDARYEF